MADKEHMDFTYTTIDRLFRLSIGETADFSGAKYDGDFSLTLEEAQKAKHDYIREKLGIGKNSRVIDLGSGWGPFLRYIAENTEAKAIGLTLSGGQAKACAKNNLEVYVKNCKTVKPEDFGKFDAAVSLGAFEHFCSIEEFKAGKQEQVYKDFFQTVSDLLPEGGRFYLQTMTFGKNMIPYEEFDIDASKDSDAYILALMEKQFPGSWLPKDSEMVINCAKPYFKLTDISNGRKDYIETIKQWRARFHKLTPSKLLFFIKLIPKYFVDPEFRHRVNIFRLNPNKVCFERELMDHYRMVFEKV